MDLISLFNRNIRSILMISFTLTYLSGSILRNEKLILLTSILLIPVILKTLPLVSSAVRRTSLTLIFVGGFLLYANHIPPAKWLYALGANAGLSALFLFMPMFTFALVYGDYEPALRRFSQKYVSSSRRFAVIYSLLAYFFSMVLNLGSFSIIHSIYKKSASSQSRDMILSATMARANIAPIFWSPSYVGMAVVVSYTNVPWIQLLPKGILLSILMMITIVLSNLYNMRKSCPAPDVPEDTASLPVDMGKLLQLLVICLLLLGMVAVFNIFTDLSILVIIPLVAMIYAPAVALIQGKLPCYREQLRNYYHITIPNTRAEIVIFAAAGFFGESLELSGVGKSIAAVLQPGAIGQNGLFFLVIAVMGCILGTIGVHPVVVTSAIASSLTAFDLGISPLTYTYMLLAVYGFSVLVSPFSGTSLILSGLFGKSPWEIGPKLNMYYTGLVIIIFAFLFSLVP